MMSRFSVPQASISNDYNYVTSAETNFDGSILTLLESQLDNFPSIHSYINTNVYKPASILLPQSLKHLDELLTTKEELILELISFLDIISLYSIEVYGDSETYIDLFIKGLVNNRIKYKSTIRLAESVLDEYTFSDIDSTTDFFTNNKLIVALYIYAMVSMIFYHKGVN